MNIEQYYNTLLSEGIYFLKVRPRSRSRIVIRHRIAIFDNNIRRRYTVKFTLTIYDIYIYIHPDEIHIIINNVYKYIRTASGIIYYNILR